MDMHDLTGELIVKNESKIVMVVADGLGGLPLEPGGPTELEAANTPNLDALARRGVLGRTIPVRPGISPGSGPGHLGLFGYDPLTYRIGRGALEATGIGFELLPGDVAIRCNFCTLDAAGNITDRRAGRIPTEQSAPLATSLRAIRIGGVEVFVEPVKEHRFVVVFRGEGLGGNVHDTDPQVTGVPPLVPRALDQESERTAEVAQAFVTQARELIAPKGEEICTQSPSSMLRAAASVGLTCSRGSGSRSLNVLSSRPWECVKFLLRPPEVRTSVYCLATSGVDTGLQ